MSAAGRGTDVLRVGISACLLGREVRWDGGHKRDPLLNDMLADAVEWIPVYPEVESGMPVPREPIHLERRSGGTIGLVGVGSGIDHTRAMERFARGRVRQLQRAGLDGFVCKAGSPSCGLHDVKIHRETGRPLRQGRGLFAAALARALPALPVEDEGRLHDPALRENFIERLFARQRLRALFSRRFSMARLVAFHSEHRLQLRAHGKSAPRPIDRLLAGARGRPAAEIRSGYTARFMRALSRIATRDDHANALEHAAGQLVEQLDAASRRELADEIRAYRRGRAPLLVPITLLRHHVRVHRVAALVGQTYLEPHPREWMLRNPG